SRRDGTRSDRRTFRHILGHLRQCACAAVHEMPRTGALATSLPATGGWNDARDPATDDDCVVFSWSVIVAVGWQIHVFGARMRLGRGVGLYHTDHRCDV